MNSTEVVEPQNQEQVEENLDYDQIMAEQEAKLAEKTKGDHLERKKPLIHKDKKIWDSADEMRIASKEDHHDV